MDGRFSFSLPSFTYFLFVYNKKEKEEGKGRKNRLLEKQGQHVEKQGQHVEKQGQPVDMFLSKINDLDEKKSQTTHFSRNASHLQDENTPGQPPFFFGRPQAMTARRAISLKRCGERKTNSADRPDMKKPAEAGWVDLPVLLPQAGNPYEA